MHLSVCLCMCQVYIKSWLWPVSSQECIQCLRGPVQVGACTGRLWSSHQGRCSKETEAGWSGSRTCNSDEETRCKTQTTQGCKLRLFTLKPSSHHRHRQDKTVLSCLAGVGGVNWIGDKSRLSAFLAVLSGLKMRCERCELRFVLSRPSFQFAARRNYIQTFSLLPQIN